MGELTLGWKKSGYGRFGSKYGFEEFLQTKTITIKFNETL
jgi:acyl-CoA reductase-like NAD-dependent aldehyde dehydrogenase